MSVILQRDRRLKPARPVRLAPEFQALNPKIIVHPASSINLVDGAGLVFSNDAAIRGGNFNFPGANGYIDLGSTAHISTTDYTAISISKLLGFGGGFPVIYGVKSSSGQNLMAFHDTGTYKDVTIGHSGSGTGDIFPLNGVVGYWNKLVYVKRTVGVSGRLWAGGVEKLLTSTAGLGASSGNSCLGQLNPGNLSTDFYGDIALFALFGGAFPDALAARVSENPWSLFQAEPRRLYIVPASTGGSPQTLEPTAAEAIGEVGVPSLSAGSAALVPSAATATAEVGTATLTGSGFLSPSAAIAAAEAAVPTLTAGLASLVPAAASAVAEADVPSLTAGGANITPIAAIATAGVDNPDLTTEGSVLTPQVAIATAGVGNPILTAGAVTLAPSAASATAAVTDPSITNGSQLSPSAASASAAVSNPVLSAGAVSVDAEAAVAAANAEGSVFSAGGVQLAPPAASAVAVGSVPEITSGKVIDSVPAVAVAGVGSASFIAGQASIIPASAEGIAAGSTPAFALGQVALLPSAAFATAVVGDSFLIDGGMQWHSEMLYTIEAEDRSFTIPAENRAFSVPAV